MKNKIIYTTVSIAVIIILVMVYLNIAGGKNERDNSSALNGSAGLNEGSINNQSESIQSTFSPQSGGWQLQVMPNMGSRLVRDIYFTDSLTGYAVASPNSYTDSAHILKTTNGGYNWIIKFTKEGKLNRIIYLNSQIGFAGGDFLLKTTNSGENWMVWNWSLSRVVDDMQIFSEDTIWYSYSDPISGGVFRTTNGGLNWEKRDSGIPANSYPDKIYFYNSRIGFAYHIGNPFGHKTTNGGENWLQTDSGFIDIHFNDSLVGFRSWNNNGIQKTTNSGLNWIDLSMPNVQGLITNKQILKFIIINKDTIYAVGAYFQRPDFSYRALVYKTTNMGLNWNYLYPDTGFAILRLTTLYAVNNNVWAYSQYNNKGIYSITGGGISKIKDISNENLLDYNLSQNYPNPFNSKTKIEYEIKKTSRIKISLYDIFGRELKKLVEKNIKPGFYEYIIDGEGYPSGVYFYSLSADGNLIQTKKLVLLK